MQWQYYFLSIHTVGKTWGGGRDITKISCSCKHYNGILLRFITLFYMLLDCFPVGIVHIPVQKLTFLNFDPRPKNSVGNVYILV